PEERQVAEARVGAKDDVAAAAAVAAVWPALRHVLLAPEAQAPVAAAAGKDFDAGAVVKHRASLVTVCYLEGTARPSGGIRPCNSLLLGVGRLGGLGDPDEALLAGRTELDGALALGEDGVVAADAGACAGAEPGPALTDDDHAGLHLLTGEDLDAEPLRVRVAAVPGGTEAFLVSH